MILRTMRAKEEPHQSIYKVKVLKNRGANQTQAPTKQIEELQKNFHIRERMLAPIMITIGESCQFCFNPKKRI